MEYQKKFESAKNAFEEAWDDKKITWADKKQIEQVIDFLKEEHTQEVHKEARENTTKIILETLEKGYSVNNDNDYQVFRKIFEYAYPNIPIPEKKPKVYDLTFGGGKNYYTSFSITIWNDKIPYVYDDDGDQIWELSSNGFYYDTRLEIFDDNQRNNNIFNTNSLQKATGFNDYSPDFSENTDSDSEQINGGQTVTPVRNKAEDTEKATKDIPEQKETKNTDIEKIKNMDKAAILEKLGQLSAHEKHFSSIRKNKEHIALIQRVAEIYNVPRVRSYVNKNNFVDGIYWEGTRQAVREVQEKLGNLYTDSIDGWAGTNTIDAVIQKWNS